MTEMNQQKSDEVSSAATSWGNLPAKPPERTSAGVCGMHGVFVGACCPKCVTQPKGLSNG